MQPLDDRRHVKADEAEKKWDRLLTPTPGQWLVHLHAKGGENELKWRRLLPMARVDQEPDAWPHGLVTAGEGVMATLAELARAPEVMIVDGGATHPTTATKLRARHV
jgi:hypothetical protein